MHIATASRLMGLGMGMMAYEGPNEGSGEGSGESTIIVDHSIMKPMICADFDTGEAVPCTVDETGRTLVSSTAANAAANTNSKLPPKTGKLDVTTIVLFAVAGFAVFKLVRG